MKLRKTLAGILGAVVMLLGVGTFEHVNRETGVKAADGDKYVKVTSAPTDWSGDYLIVCEEANVCFNGSLTSLDVANNNCSIKISNGTIAATDVNKYKFTINKSGDNYTIKSDSGFYIGNTADSNKLNSDKSTKYTNTISLDTDGSVKIVGSGKSVLRYNSNSGNYRFRYFKSGTYKQQKAIQLYKLVEGEIPTLDTPDVKLDAATGVVTWTEVENANGYTYKINDNEVQTTNTYVELKSGETFSVKSNGTEGKFNSSAYTEPVTFTSYSDKVVSLLNDEYNKGSYLRHTIINIDADAVMEDLERLNESLNPEKQVNYADLFHAEVTMLERNTYFDGNQLWMENEEGTYSYYGTSENGKDLTSDRVSTLDDTSDKVVLKDVGGMEGYYTTLTDIIEHSKTAAWTYYNGVYTSENEQLIKDFLDFTAPCFYNAFSKDGLENYIKLSSITVQSIDDQVVLKLLVEDGDSGKLVGEQNIVLSQARISKGTTNLATLATFEFGENGEAVHADGNDLGTSKTYTENDYSLELNNMSKVFGPAYDAMGNSCIKLGTSSVVGSFKFTVPSKVNKVVINVSGYKTNSLKLTINGTDYEVSTTSNSGVYTAIEIDASITKTISLTTKSSPDERCMINSIEYHA